METDKEKKIQKSGKKETSIIRSSAAEYLTFVAASGKGGVEAVYADENIWLTQKMMGVLYDVETHTINYHLKKVFADSELEEDSVIRNFRITAADRKNYNTRHYNLSAIIAVGYKVNSERAVQFRKWAEKSCRTQAELQQKLPEPMPKVNLKNTASSRIGFLKVTSTG